MSSRRDFLRHAYRASASMAVLSLAPRTARAALEGALSGAWGVQIYTVRDLLATKAAETMKAIAAIGYREVEMLRAALDLMPLVKEAGLAAPGMHIEAPIVTGEWGAWKARSDANRLPPETYTIDSAIADAKKQGIRYLTVAYLMPEERGTLDFYRRFADAMNRAGEKCTAAGLVLSYHHHAFEFEPLEARLPFDLLVERFDPKLVGFEIDVFWVSIAGRDPVKTIRDLGPRVRLLHLKDKAKGTPNEFQEGSVKPGAFVEVGSGVVDFPGVLAAGKAAGVTHAFVEQDHTPGDPIASLKKSFDYLKTLGA